MANRPRDFSFTVVGDDVVITHAGRHASTLRGVVADKFLSEVEGMDPQLLMARVTGNYKHGNEGTSRDHPRNKGR